MHSDPNCQAIWFLDRTSWERMSRALTALVGKEFLSYAKTETKMNTCKLPVRILDSGNTYKLPVHYLDSI